MIHCNGFSVSVLNEKVGAKLNELVYTGYVPQKR